MTKTLKITLEIEVEEMTTEELTDAGFYEAMGDDEDEDDLLAEEGGVIDGYEAREFADLLPYVIKHPDNEMFAGTGIFAKIGEVKVVSSGWSE